jgi:uncharacterized caspase-like protein
MAAMNKPARGLSKTCRNGIFVLTLALLTGCAGMNMPQSLYSWTPDTPPASESIEVTALIETEHEMSPELVQTWRNLMNTEQNIINYRAAVSNALFEDMNRSKVFAGVTRTPRDRHDLLVKITSRETKKGEHYLFTVAAEVIDPRTGREVLAYQREADLGTSFFANNSHLRKELSRQLADIRTAMLDDFRESGSPGRLAFFSSQPETTVTPPTLPPSPLPNDMAKDTRPPEITLFSPGEDRGLVTIRQEKTDVIGLARDESPVVTVLINDQQAELTPSARGGVKFTATVVLPPETRELTVQAIDQSGNRAVKSLRLERVATPIPAGKEPAGLKPSLWVLAVGVSEYQDPGLNLRYADHDARAIVQALQAQEGKLFAEINTKLLLNADGTRENILDAMSRFLGMASYNDLVLIFIAGHGVKDRQTGSYYFVTHDATPDSLMTRGLLWSTFDEAHKRLANNVSKVMLWLDTCHAGAMNVAMRGLEAGEDLSLALRSAEGTYILTASKPGENSEEDESFRLAHEQAGHGAFTYSLLDGLAGKADMDGDRSISVSELSSYVAKKVPRLTQGRQHPFFRMSGTDMPIFMP